MSRDYVEPPREGKGRKAMYGSYQLVWSRLPQDKVHEVAVIVTEDIGEGITDIEYANERILKAPLQIRNLRVTMTQVYAPQRGRTTQETTEQKGNAESIVVIGDMNGPAGSERTGTRNVTEAFDLIKKRAKKKD